jgi:class 3 adenylate cyclase
MSHTERRYELRTDPSLKLTPVNCVLVIEDQEITTEIINYHYRGACLKFELGDYRLQQKGAYLKFRVGNQSIQEKIVFKIIWETISENGLCGVEFTTESSYVLSRAERFLVNNINSPVISSQDPLDPNRIIYFKVLNASTTGMLISTSLANKHLFPGMELRTAILSIPGFGKTDLELFIENSRPGVDETVWFGVSVKGMSHNYQDLISKYLSSLAQGSDKENRIEQLKNAGLLVKEIKQNLSIREVKTKSDYDAVLKLRFDGYSRAGKVQANVTYKDMGDGLDHEGLVLAGYLGGQIIASVELRFSKLKKLRVAEKFEFHSHPYLRSREFVEINKLVVSPAAQNTDVVVGMFQKIHALTMLNGKPDGLLIAEDRLITLYERLGAKKVGLSYPHPTKTDTNLHLMCIPRETYENGSGINPLAWTTIYSNTQEFLSSAGLTKPRTLSLWERSIAVLSKIWLRNFKKYQKRKNNGTKDLHKAESPELNDFKVRSVIDPKWTLQHLNATVLLPYLLVSDELVGREKTDKILLQYNIKRSYFQSSSNWISVPFFDQFIDDFKKIGNVDLLQQLAGYKNISKEVLGVNLFLLKHFLTPREAFKAFGNYLPKFNKTRTCQVVESSASHCKIRIGLLDPALKPRDPSAKLNWIAILDGHVLQITGKHANIHQTQSIFDGGDYCEYVVRWENPLFSFRFLILASFLAISLGWGFKTAVENFGIQTILIVTAFFSLIVLSLTFGLLSRDRNRKYLSMVDSLEQFQKEADERYRELQNSKALLEKNYQEGKLLEAISREIQISEDLPSILNKSLESLCTNFDIQRAFIMTLDDSGKILRTSSMFGAGESSTDLWQFKVDVSIRRHNSMLLSAVYQTGQSVLISNIEEHKFHLNESSRLLIEKLKTKAFAIVPIPSSEKNWGVLVADKGSSKDTITRRDLVALQRVSQSIGIALDKKAKLESEIRARKIFQKYVPSVVVESTLGDKEPKLGGHNREALCLFLDIRNFTSLSDQLPPEILCTILNDIFDLLQKSVSKQNGIIDKFLGDGALVTWGAVPGSTVASEKALTAAIEFMQSLDGFNLQIQKKGLAPIEVGIGIHKGPVIAGNIGSTDRMEFTVIGSTVNIASRLEQLTKVFKSHVVISEEVQGFDSLPAGWTIHQNVQVRGLSTEIKVASLHWNQKLKSESA